MSQIAASSSSFAALIWWLVPLGGVIFAFAYVLWISKYKSKYENKTNRSVGSFQKFQNSFDHNSQSDKSSRDSK